MSVVVVGVDHRRVRADVLERFALNVDTVQPALERLLKSDHITEAVILSTCMRTEVYVDAFRFHGAVADIRSMLADVAGLAHDAFVGDLYEMHEHGAYRHLFRVAAGLESAVVGESEVLGQVNRAWQGARRAGAAKSILSGLFRHALEVGKRARHETAVSRGTTSVGQAAVAMAQSRIGDLRDKRALVVGAGDMGDSMAVALSSGNGVGDIVVVNRTHARAEALADRIGGEASEFRDLSTMLRDFDVVLASTGAPEAVITAADLRRAMDGRADRAMVVVDVAVPRDVEPEAAAIPGVTVLDMTDLRRFADVGKSERGREVAAVEAIVEEEVIRYDADVTARLVAPAVTALRERAETMRKAELERHRHKLQEFTPAQRETVEALTKSVLAKLLHDPTIRLKRAAGTPDGERMAEAVRMLFDA